MAVYRVAIRYSRAIFQSASERGILAAVYNDFCLIHQLCNLKEAELVAVLKNPVIPRLEKKALFDNVFKGKVDPLTSDFFSLLLHKKREGLLDEIAGAFIAQYDKINGLVKASLVTPFPVSDSMIKDFTTKVEKMTGCKEVALSTHVDEALIGGYVLTIGDKQIDQSLRTKLNFLKSDIQTLGTTHG